jgi:glyoxalase/bleomycin resistance protein/dioxygenase superfamily protein
LTPSDTSGVLEGPIRQVGYIVSDLDAAIARWCAIGVGPWFTIRNLPQTGCQYRGELSEPTISLALSNSGPMQIELIQQHDDTPSIYREFIEAHGEGFHQYAYWPTDFDGVMERAAAAGWPVVWSGEMGGLRFAYLEVDPSISTIIEIMELTDMSRGMGELVESAAADWDGVTDPVRSLL